MHIYEGEGIRKGGEERENLPRRLKGWWQAFQRLLVCAQSFPGREGERERESAGL